MGAESCWTMIGALGTWGAVVAAGFAYAQSLKMRKNSAFNALFTQLMENHKEVFANKKRCSDFYVMLYNKLDDVRNIRDLCDIWGAYNDSMKSDSVKFSHAFKFVYHEVITVLDDDTINDLSKRRYIGIIQAMMNKDELFCYLVNLLQHFENYPEDDNDYREQLKQYHFFDDLLREHDRRYSEVMAHLCTCLYADVSRLIDI